MFNSVADVMEAAEARRRVASFDEAMAAKVSGDLVQAALLLRRAVSPPSIYHGHYRELFKIYRMLNKADMASGDLRSAASRLLEMVHLETEMIAEMLRYWSEVNRRRLPLDHFDSYRKLGVNDAKLLAICAARLCDASMAVKAEELVVTIRRRAGR